MDTQPILNQQPKKAPLAKIILAVLAIIVIGELIWAAKSLISGNRAGITLTQNQAVPTQPAQITLTSDKQSLRVGDKVTVNIMVDTGGKNTDGTDVILNFDPKTLVVDASPSAKPVNPGTIYANYPKNALEKDGKLSISGITSVGSSFSGQGVLGSVTFKAVAVGTTSVAVDFKLGSTTDSNIIESQTAKDILTNAKSLTLTISP